jgi:hypothetical protein
LSIGKSLITNKKYMGKLDQIPAAAPELEITKMSEIKEGSLQNKDGGMRVITPDGRTTELKKADYDEFLEDYKNGKER